MTAPQKRSWRNVLIAPSYQLKFVLWFSIHGLVLGLFYSALMSYLVRSTFVKLLQLTDVSESNRAVLLGSFDTLLWQALGATILFILLCALSGLMFSHRSAGPLHRLKQLFAQVRDGDLAVRCHLRKGDHFADVADLFNQMMNAVEARPKNENR